MPLFFGIYVSSGDKYSPLLTRHHRQKLSAVADQDQGSGSGCPAGTGTPPVDRTPGTASCLLCSTSRRRQHPLWHRCTLHLISCVCHAVVLEFIVLYNREHGRKTVKNTHTHTLHTLVEVIDKVLLLPLKCITVTAGNCVSRQREPVIIITSTPSISGICDTSPGFHFYPDSALFHLPRAIFTSCLIVQTGG